MNKEQIIEYISHPEALGENNFSDLKLLSEKFPYSGILQTLYAKALHNNDSIFFEEQLKKAAITNANRKKLYQLIHQPKLQKTIEKIEKNSQIEEKVEAQEKVTPKVDTTEKEIAPMDKAEPIGELDELEKNILTEAINLSMLQDVSDVIPSIEDIVTGSNQELHEEEASVIEETEKSEFTDWFSNNSKPFKKRQDISQSVEGFLDKNKTTPKKKEFFSPTNLAKMSLVDNEEFVTETLAKVYASQGNFKKAIRIYERLMIDNPEKMTFFASRIRFLKDKKENKKE